MKKKLYKMTIEKWHEGKCTHRFIGSMALHDFADVAAISSMLTGKDSPYSTKTEEVFIDIPERKVENG